MHEAADGASDLDGRRLRREHNREAVLDALISFYEEGRLSPASAEVAERAGLSARSLFRYFDDVDDLNRSAIERMVARARPLLELSVAVDDPLVARIEAVVASRVRLFEAIGPAARAARAGAHRSAVVTAQVGETRSYLRHQVEKLFRHELSGARSVLLPTVDVLLEFETFDLLRNVQGLSRARTVATLTAALSALLAPDGGT